MTRCCGFSVAEGGYRGYMTPMAEGNPPLPATPSDLEAALSAAGLGVFAWRASTDLLSISACAAEIIGEPAGDHPNAAGLLYSQTHPEDLATVREALARLAKEGRFEVEFRSVRPKDGRTVWLRVTAVRGGREDGRDVVGVVQNVTALKLEEAQRQRLMVELDHRVKNVLSAVQALASQSARRTTSLDSFLQTFAGRLKAMASANELLTATRWRGAEISHLAAAELGGVAPRQAHWEGPEIYLTPRAANAVSLALHELATNALKYGALTAEKGRVAVEWRRTESGGFELRWTESGGPPVHEPTRRGFGHTLLTQITGRELNGQAQIDYDPGGVRALLCAGPPAIAARTDAAYAPAPSPREPEPAPDQPAQGLQGARVLIVEDAVLLALELETGLEDAGARIVGPAYELGEAMALLDQPIDAAVLDVNLNGQIVTPVALELTRRGGPFVFATGYGGAGAPEGFSAPIIRKPYDVTQVTAAIARLLA